MFKYGLIGYPVKHSFSAAMHNAAFSYLNLDAKYELFELKPEQVAEFLSCLKNKNIRGLNVTIPHKEFALQFLDEKSPEVEQIGAVNTICVTQQGKLKGFNTDCSGFLRHISETGIAFKRAAIIGAGGAAKAVVIALLINGINEIALYDIDKSRSLCLAQRAGGFFPQCSILVKDSISELKILEKDILINASGVGMKEEDVCIVSEQYLHKNLFVYDLIYNPAQTKLLKLAQQKGLKFSNGLKMLLYQGMQAFELWTHQDAPLEIMFKALNEEVRK
ncbi:MAG: shikimate dehydrogenase [Candidatus Omnitrophota bacterium]|nr:MAG: shikimate dehydrogenase [Candidatus Omnitrophota bacterium]